MWTIDELVSRKAIRQKVVEIKNFKETCVPYSQAEKILESGNHPLEPVIVDDAVWVGQNTRGDITWSCNKEGVIYQYSLPASSLAIRTVDDSGVTEEDDSLRLKSSKVIHLKGKGVYIMENNNADNLNDLKKLFNAEEGGTEAPAERPVIPNAEEGDMKKMDSFENTDKETGKETETKSETNTRLDLIKSIVTSATEGVKTADANELYEFNRTEGALLGYVVMNEPVIKCGTKVNYLYEDDTNSKYKLTLDASADDRAEYERTGVINKKFVEKEYELRFKQTAPGKVLGGVIAIPEGGFVSYSQLQGDEPVQFDKSRTTLEYCLLNTEDLYRMVQFHFGAYIYESAETFKEHRNKVEFSLVPVNKVNENEASSIPELKPVLKSVTRRNLMTPTSFFPIKVFKTINANGQFTEQEAEEMNQGTFIHLVQGQRGSKMDLLVPKDKKDVWIEDGKVVSTYFSTDLGKRKPLNVLPFYGRKGDQYLSSLDIPVKTLPMTKDNKKGKTYKYVTYNCISKDAEDATKSKFTSLNIAKYKPFLEATRGCITKESLRDVLKSKGTTAETKKAFSPEQAKALMLKDLQGELQGLNILGVKSSKGESMKDISERLLKTRKLAKTDKTTK